MIGQESRIDRLLERAATELFDDGLIPLDTEVALLREGYDFRNINRDVDRIRFGE